MTTNSQVDLGEMLYQTTFLTVDEKATLLKHLLSSSDLRVVYEDMYCFNLRDSEERSQCLEAIAQILRGS